MVPPLPLTPLDCALIVAPLFRLITPLVDSKSMLPAVIPTVLADTVPVIAIPPLPPLSDIEPPDVVETLAPAFTLIAPLLPLVIETNEPLEATAPTAEMFPLPGELSPFSNPIAPGEFKAPTL